ncbi:MAG: hypothetical protein ACRCTY_10185, partial [Candidatus Adiutrix sp.]
GFTPYVRNELAVLSIAWSPTFAVVANQGLSHSASLKALAQSTSRRKLSLAHSGHIPHSVELLMAIKAAEKLGFQWELSQFSALHPDIVVSGQADTMVLPLWQALSHENSPNLKVISVLSDEESPCGGGLSNLTTEGTPLGIKNVLAFYVPTETVWARRSRLALAINEALSQPALQGQIKNLCFTPFLKDVDDAVAILDEQFNVQETFWQSADVIGPQTVVLGP